MSAPLTREEVTKEMEKAFYTGEPTHLLIHPSLKNRDVFNTKTFLLGLLPKGGDPFIQSLFVCLARAKMVNPTLVPLGSFSDGILFLLGGCFELGARVHRVPFIEDTVMNLVKHSKCFLGIQTDTKRVMETVKQGYNAFKSARQSPFDLKDFLQVVQSPGHPLRGQMGFYMKFIQPFVEDNAFNFEGLPPFFKEMHPVLPMEAMLFLFTERSGVRWIPWTDTFVVHLATVFYYRRVACTWYEFLDAVKDIYCENQYADEVHSEVAQAVSLMVGVNLTPSQTRLFLETLYLLEKGKSIPRDPAQRKKMVLSHLGKHESQAPLMRRLIFCVSHNSALREFAFLKETLITKDMLDKGLIQHMRNLFSSYLGKTFVPDVLLCKALLLHRHQMRGVPVTPYNSLSFLKNIVQRKVCLRTNPIGVSRQPGFNPEAEAFIPARPLSVDADPFIPKDVPKTEELVVRRRCCTSPDTVYRRRTSPGTVYTAPF